MSLIQNLNGYDIVGYIAGVLTLISSIPQLTKIIKYKSVKDVSLTTYIILLLAQILWTIYGFYKHDLQIIIPNIISGCISFFIICVFFYFK